MGNKEIKVHNDKEEKKKDFNEDIVHSKPASPFMKLDTTYPYACRNCVYRSEKLELSNSERTTIQNLMESASIVYKNPESQEAKPITPAKRPVKLILDTDVGTDIDDVLALLMMLNIPKEDMDLVGVTTNYYPTLYRAYVAKKILKAGGYDDVPVIAGNCYVMGTHRDHFLHGNEAEGLGLTPEEIEALWKAHETSEAEDFMYSMVKKYPSEVIICAIGMTTNLGRACEKYSDFTKLVGHIYIMGGGSIGTDRVSIGTYCGNDKSLWGKDGSGSESKEPLPFTLPGREFVPTPSITHPILLFPNHNLCGDVLATKILFEHHDCPISLIPHHITAQHWIDGPAIETLLEASSKELVDNNPYPESFVISGRLLFEWLSRRGRQRGQCPHDPLTVYEAIYQESPKEDNGKLSAKYSSLKYIRGTLLGTEWAGYTIFIPNPTGIHRLAVTCLEPPAWEKWLSETLLSSVDKSLILHKPSKVKTWNV
jgi:inosine-uridine nucleoside N-ribohydrolase